MSVKNIWIGGEIEDRYYMAYVMSKIASFSWVRYDMFLKDNIYECPPIFCWRYARDIDEKVYQKISGCVSSFQGQVKWVMNKSTVMDGSPGRNYMIEPEFIREIYQKNGINKLPEILEANYKEELQKAIEDVVPLAKHIEIEMGVVDANPIPPTNETAFLRERLKEFQRERLRQKKKNE